MYRIPAPPADIVAEIHDAPGLTRAQVEANPWTMKEVRFQGVCIRRELAEQGECWTSGAGSHRQFADERNFAFRVLVAKGECVRDPADSRRYIAIK